MNKTSFILSIVIMLTNACVTDNVFVIDDTNPIVDTIKVVDNEKDLEVFETGLKGLSGICFNHDSTTLMAVRDNGSIYELALNGTIIRNLGYSGSNDFEGITYDTNKGLYLFADESNSTIYCLKNNSLEKLIQLNIPNAVFNKGIEGIAYHADTLYIVNQESPCLLILYDLKNKKEISRKTITFVSFLADITYNKTTHTLWIVDSKTKMLIQLSKNGNFISSQSIAIVPKAEGLAIDLRKRMAWIACDETGKLFKIKINTKQ